MREACLIIHRRELQEIIVGDNQLLISLSSKEDDPPWEISSFIKDICDLARERNLSFRFVNRCKNRATHWVASRVRLGLLFGDWIGCPLPRIVSLLASSG